MIKINFWFFLSLQDLTKTKQVEVDANRTVKHAMEKNFEIYRENFNYKTIDKDSKDVKRYIIVFVNRKDIHNLNGLSTKINDGDEIAIFPAVAERNIKNNMKNIK